MRAKEFIFKCFIFIFIISIFIFCYGQSKAADLTDVMVNISDNRPMTTVNYEVGFKLSTAQKLKEIDVQFAKTEVDNQKPANLSFEFTTLGIVSGLSQNWTIDKSAADTGLIKIVDQDEGEEKEVGHEIKINLLSIRSPEIGDCSTSGTIYDECSLKVETYSLQASNTNDQLNTNQSAELVLTDSGFTTYRIEDVPSLSFAILGVSDGIQTNGITTTISTDYNLIDFGTVRFGEAKYGAQRLYVATTAPNGYQVSMKLDGYFEGMSGLNKIDPFYSAWTDPQSWSSPYGTEKNSDTGWIGANTSDNRVLGWLNAAGKFGPVSSTPHTVMTSNKKDYGTNAYITYAIEVNSLQTPDSYSGTIIYNITATY